MRKVPKLIKSKSIYKNPFQEIIVDTLELDNIQWEQVYFVKPNKNGVAVLPIDDTGIYLVNQYRHASGKFLWQIPMGMIDKNSTELETAKKELLEEAGLIAKELIRIGSIIPEPGMSNQEEIIYIAKGLRRSKQHLQITEFGMKVNHFTFKEIDRMVKNGEIKCGFTLSALYLLKVF